MALAALPFDLVWSSCSHILPLQKSFSFSLFLQLQKKKKAKNKNLRQGCIWYPQEVLGVERSSSSLVGYVSKLSRTEYWFTDAGSS